MSTRHLRTEAIVLKRNNYADADRFITLFSKEYGKMTAMAKGIRKINSQKRAALEPFNLVSLSLYQGKSVPLITEARLINSFNHLKTNYMKMTQGYQILEIIDMLTVEDVRHDEIYHRLIQTLHELRGDHSHKTTLIETIKFFLEELGFSYQSGITEAQLKLHIEAIADKPLLAKKYLFLKDG